MIHWQQAESQSTKLTPAIMHMHTHRKIIILTVAFTLMGLSPIQAADQSPRPGTPLLRTGDEIHVGKFRLTFFQGGK